MAEFIGLFIPKDILSIKELNLTEKCLLMQIIPLCVSEPCYASNSFFAERIGITETTVSTSLKSLDDKGYIQTLLDRKQGNKRTVEIFYFEDTLFKNLKDPSLKTLNTLFKNLKDPLKNSCVPYLNNLKTLFKNLNFIYKEESKEESKEENIILIVKPNPMPKELPPEEKVEGFDLAAQERLQNPIKPHEMTTLTIEETKERFLNDNGLFELFVRATKLERKNFDKSVEMFIKHTTDKIEYPRLYDRGNDDSSKKHFKNWFRLKDPKEFTVAEPKPQPQPIDEAEIARQRKVVRDREDAYLEKLREQKMKSDERELNNRKNNESNLRRLSSNLSAKGVPAYLLQQ